MFYTYILKCKDDTFYTGYTSDLKKRVKIHNDGLGAKYTKSRLPVQLVWFQTFSTKSEAMQKEFQIKRLSRKEKLALIKG